jgi:hypothetical protein
MSEVYGNDILYSYHQIIAHRKVHMSEFTP